MKIYVSGPMRGYPHFNFPAFDVVSEHLREGGHTVFSPADHDREMGHEGLESGDLSELQQQTQFADMRDFARWDVERIMESDLVVMLPGHERSVGARAEKALAEWVGVPVAYATLPSQDVKLVGMPS